MKNFRRLRWRFVASTCVSVAIVASLLIRVRAEPGEPSDARVSVPAVSYRSPFTGYRAFDAEATVPWKDANETVGRIGGWRAYAKEAAEAARIREAEQAKKQTPSMVPRGPATPAPKTSDPPRPAHRHGG